MQSPNLELWKSVCDATKAPICVFDTEYRLIGFNQAHDDDFFRIYNYRQKLGDCFPDLFSPDQAPIMRGFMARALAGESFYVSEAFGDPDIVKPYWDIFYTPLRNTSGEIIGAFHYAQDISERLRAQALLARAEAELLEAQRREAEALRREVAAHRETLAELTEIKRSLEDRVQAQVAEIRHATDRFKVALDGTDVLMFEMDEDLTFTWAQNIGEELEDAYNGSIVGLNDRTQVQSSAESLAMKEQVLATGARSQGVTTHELPDGSALYYQINMAPTTLANGRKGVVGVATNITRVKEHEKHLETVMRELTHRSKNLLAVVQSIAVQTARSATSVPHFNDTFSARLMALANAHDLIANGQWHGAAVTDLAQRQLLHLISSYPDRIRLSGPPVILEPEVAQYVGLALHELGTNAVKYGALACDDGVITVNWSCQDKRFELEWCETGSIPAPKETPRRGFGRMLLEAVVPKAAKGFAELTFDPGLRWRLRA